MKSLFRAHPSSGPRQVSPEYLLEVSPEWKLGWGLLINNQQIKYIFFILPRNLLRSLFQATR